MSTVLDTARALARLSIKGVIDSSSGAADADKLIKTNEDGVIDASVIGTVDQLDDHIADATKHLTSAQNTLLDSLTATATELNYVAGVTSAIQTQLNSKALGTDLTTHIADATKHLTASQNTLLDALTVDATELNYVDGVTSDIQTQLDSKALAADLTTHIADDTKHLTAGQNTLLDSLTATATELNYVAGVTSAIQTQFSNLNASNLVSGTIPDARFPATLPALSGVNLTALNATNLGSGTIPDARFPTTLPALSGANLTNLNASNISSGSLALARITGYGTEFQLLSGNGWTYGVPTKVSTFNSSTWSSLATIGLSYANSIIVYSDSVNNENVEIPLNSSIAFPIGTTIMFIQQDNGYLSFSAVGGVTMTAFSGVITAGQGAIATITKIDTNTWILSGNLTT